MALQSRFGGIELETAWGKQVSSWWSYEMANTLQQTSMEKEQNIVRLKSKFERAMVNATLKSIERMGRDLAQMQGSLEEKLDPRLVDARMRTAKPQNYWSEEHKWGPNWPIGDASNRTQIARADAAQPDTAQATEILPDTATAAATPSP
jgi:hypothetical protein